MFNDCVGVSIENESACDWYRKSHQSASAAAGLVAVRVYTGHAETPTTQ